MARVAFMDGVDGEAASLVGREGEDVSLEWHG
jgi:hypothetical protein